MGTKISEIYEYALSNVESYELRETRDRSPALLMRQLWGYMQAGIPLFNMPPGIEKRLEYTPPEYDDCIIIVKEGESQIDTKYIGMDIVSATLGRDAIDGEYDSVSGIIKLSEPAPQQWKWI